MILVKIPSNSANLILPPIPQQAIGVQIIQANPEPKPPKQTVTIGDTVMSVENRGHPQYEEDYKSWEEDVGLKTTLVMFRMIALAQRMDDDKREQVQDFRENFGDLMPLSPNDKIVWFFNFGMPSNQDDVNVMLESAIKQKNMFLSKDKVEEILPTHAEPHPEAVETYRESFPSDVQAEKRVRVTDTIERD